MKLKTIKVPKEIYERLEKAKILLLKKGMNKSPIKREKITFGSIIGIGAELLIKQLK